MICQVLVPGTLGVGLGDLYGPLQLEMFPDCKSSRNLLSPWTVVTLEQRSPTRTIATDKNILKEALAFSSSQHANLKVEAQAERD